MGRPGAAVDDPARGARRLLPGRRRARRARGARPATGRASREARAPRGCVRHPNVVFVGGIVAVHARRARGGVLARRRGADAGWRRWLARAAVRPHPGERRSPSSVVNQLVTAFLPPRILPKLELHEHGVPARVPHRGRRAHAVRQRRGGARGAREPRGAVPRQSRGAPALRRAQRLHRRADAETRPDDDAIVAAAVEGVRALNARYAAGARTRSTCSIARAAGIRARACGWAGSASAASWREFNRFLRGGATDAFSVDRRRRRRCCASARTSSRSTPTRCCRPTRRRCWSARWRIRSTAPCYDRRAGACVRGYGILQPRVGVSLPSAHRSRFAAIHSGHPGVDPYTTAVSDVYQDLYGEGSFTGKGIYDVEAFERATHGRFPENTLLSHDLIEGNYARAGLATDVDRLRRLSDALPRRTRGASTAGSAATGSCCPGCGASCPGRTASSATGCRSLSRWKIFDNLRRSIVEIAQLLFLVAGWTVLPGLAAPLDAARRCSRSRRRGSIALLLALRPPAARQVVARLLRGGRRTTRCTSAAAGRRSRSRSCRTRPGSRPTRSCARCGACSSRTGACWSGRRRRRSSARADRTRGATSGARCGRPSRSASRGLAIALAAPSAAIGAGAPQWPLALAIVPLARARGCSRPLIAHALSAPVAQRGRGASPAARARRRDALRARCTGGSSSGSSTAETHWLAPDNFQETRAGRGDAHLADQHRPAAAGHGERARPRLHHARTR